MVTKIFMLFIFRSKHVIAIDIDPNKIGYAQHNAALYGVDDRVDFIRGDSFCLAPRLKVWLFYVLSVMTYNWGTILIFPFLYDPFWAMKFTLRKISSSYSLFGLKLPLKFMTLNNWTSVFVVVPSSIWNTSLWLQIFFFSPFFNISCPRCSPNFKHNYIFTWLQADIVFMSPPWGGPDYAKVKKFDINTMLKPRDGYVSVSPMWHICFLLVMLTLCFIYIIIIIRQFLFNVGKEIASRIIMFLPRNVDISQLAELSLSASPPWSLEVPFLNFSPHSMLR